MQTKKGIVINEMNGSISIRAEWYKDGKSIPIKEKDIEECLPIAIKNLFKIKNGENITDIFSMRTLKK